MHGGMGSLDVSAWHKHGMRAKAGALEDTPRVSEHDSRFYTIYQNNVLHIIRLDGATLGCAQSKHTEMLKAKTMAKCAM
jgi:hypothetical protein